MRTAHLPLLMSFTICERGEKNPEYITSEQFDTQLRTEHEADVAIPLFLLSVTCTFHKFPFKKRLELKAMHLDSSILIFLHKIYASHDLQNILVGFGLGLGSCLSYTFCNSHSDLISDVFHCCQINIIFETGKVSPQKCWVLNSKTIQKMHRSP